jgi:hypothetical protein
MAIALRMVILGMEIPMRSLCTLFVMIAAAALSAQSQTAETQSTQTPAVTEATQQPSLVHTAEVQPGDSLLVQAAKRALAKRQNAKNRLTVVVPGRGHISQGSTPLKPVVLPPEPKLMTQAGIDPNIVRKRNEDIQRRIDVLLDEQKRLGAEADEVVGGEVDEDAVTKRLTNLQEKIDGLRLQLKQLPPPPQR